MSLLVWLLLACGGPTAPEAPEPVRYSVVRGDTLFLIAKAHGVSVDQLRAWNGIDGDLIEVGQVLLIHSDAEASPTPRPRRRAKPAPAPVPGGLADLALPPERPCLSGPTGVDDEHGMAASEGLTGDQVRAAMSGFVHHTLRCMPDGFDPGAPLTMDITVACTGRVAAVTVTDAGGWPTDVSGCVTDVLAFTPFPAHDLPDGETFSYPLRYTAP